jgi:hypothetical protein
MAGAEGIRYTPPEEADVLQDTAIPTGAPPSHTIETGIDGFSLKVVKDKPFSITRRAARRFRSLGRTVAKGRAWAARAEATAADVKDLVRTEHPLVVGMSDEGYYKDATIYRRTDDVQWDHEKLSQATGPLYSDVVQTTHVFVLEIPETTRTEDGQFDPDRLRRALRNTLIEQGIPEIEIEKYYSERIDREVNEARLARHVKKGRVKLEPGTRRGKPVWVMTMDIADELMDRLNPQRKNGKS